MCNIVHVLDKMGKIVQNRSSCSLDLLTFKVVFGDVRGDIILIFGFFGLVVLGRPTGRKGSSSAEHRWIGHLPPSQDANVGLILGGKRDGLLDGLPGDLGGD